MHISSSRNANPDIEVFVLDMPGPQKFKLDRINRRSTKNEKNIP